MAYVQLKSEDKTEVTHKSGKRLQIVGYDLPNKIVAWELIRGALRGGDGELSLKAFAPTSIPVLGLKTANIWDLLSEDLQMRLIEIEESDVDGSVYDNVPIKKGRPRKNESSESAELRQEKREKREAAAALRAERIANGEVLKRGKQPNPLYVGLPRKIPCSNSECDKESGMGPGLLLQKAEEAGQTWQEFVAAFKCRKCNGSAVGRGKKADPKYDGIPREFPCSECKNPITIGPGALLKKAEEKGVTWQEYTADYKCQKCGGRKGRKSNPKYDGVPRKLTCPCGKESSVGPGKLLTDVDASGKTLEQYMAAYRCRSCKKELKS